MKEIIETIAQALVDQPELVSVKDHRKECSDRRCSANDTGRCFGQGKKTNAA